MASRLVLTTLIVVALLEALLALFLWPLRRFCCAWTLREVPRISCVDTERNRKIRKQMGPLLDWFEPSPWAPASQSQTLWAAIHFDARHPYTRRQHVLAPDGVELLLDWKDSPDIPHDAPLVVICHGIAGSSESKVAKELSDLCFEQGWRSVVYNRRGHGDSSLIPRAAQQAEASPAQAQAQLLSKAAPGHMFAFGEELAQTGVHRGHSRLHLEPQFWKLSSLTTSSPERRSSDCHLHASGLAGDEDRRWLLGKQQEKCGQGASPRIAGGGGQDGPVRQPASMLRGGYGSTDSLATSALSASSETGEHSKCDGEARERATGSPRCLDALHMDGTAESNGSRGVHVGDGKSFVASKPAGMQATDAKALLQGCKGFPLHCDIDDIELVAQAVQQAYPAAVKALVGFSAGSNVVVKYLGECGRKAAGGERGKGAGEGQAGKGGEEEEGTAQSPAACVFSAGVSVCNGFDLQELARCYQGKTVPNTLMAHSLQYLLGRKMDEVQAICQARGLEVDFKQLMATNNVLELETKLMLPLYPQFASTDDYYAFCSSWKNLKDVSVPMLSMSTLDDPLIPPHLVNHAIDAGASNPNIFAVVTQVGGHLAWLTGWRGRSWQDDVIMRYLQILFSSGREGGAEQSKP